MKYYAIRSVGRERRVHEFVILAPDRIKPLISRLGRFHTAPDEKKTRLTSGIQS
jgi:hypothetical protein